MPDGKMYHKSCIYHHDTEFKIEGSTPYTENGSEELPPCEYEPRVMKKDGEVKGLQYYSDWSVYAQTVQETNKFSKMSSKCTTPLRILVGQLASTKSFASLLNFSRFMLRPTSLQVG